MKKTIEEWKSELIGKKFGKLTVLDIQPHIRKSTNRKDGFEAVCLCDCGKFYTVVTSTLINGNSTSCGCETGRKTKEEWKIELVGKTFGNFLVLDVEDFFTKTGKKKGFFAVVKCNCGNVIRCSTSDLYSGHTRSCGCSKTEFFKDSISQWIENNPEKIKERVTKLRKWHENNPNHSKQISIVNLEKAQQWNKDHPEEKKIFLEKAHKEASIWLKNNKDIIKENFNLWKMEHPEEVIEARRRSLLSRFSNEEKDVYEFLLSLGCNVERQFYVGDHFYDFRIDDFLIEYNGSAYHYSNFEFLDSPNSKEPSICKPKNYHVVVRNNAIIHGFNIIQIWDFDWIHKKEFIKKLIKDQLFHLANYKDYLEGNLLNNDFGFIVEGDFIMSKGKWVSSKYRKVVDSTYTKG